jgi:hypothetical protein
MLFQAQSQAQAQPSRVQIVCRATLLGALCLLLVGLSACGGGVEDASNDIQVENIALQRNRAGAPVVTGRIKSERPNPINVAQVQVTLFGPTNERTGAATFTVRDLQPNEWKEFEELIEADVDVQRARVRSVVVMN